ncbi:MAG TPA: OmpA family protein [Xanthobacteraceae bacterium]|nr:OmpA family protein [Xanthobacteraceae bacterium]
MPAAVVAPQNREQVLDSNRRADEWRSRRIQDLHTQRQEVREGNRTVIREPDRTIVQENGRTFIRHNEVDRLSFGARDVRVEQRGRNTVTIVERPGGIRIVTVVDPEGHLLRRSRFDRSGREIIIINTPERAFRRPGEFFLALPPPIIRIPRERYIVDAERVGEEEIYETLMAPPVDMIDGAYSLDEIRYNASLRDRMARVDVDTITFETGAWEVTPDQIGRLAVIADAIQRVVSRHPEEVFLIEGHTDAVGSDVDNLSLSDRRAQSVAEILATQFQVPAENLVTQGYGEQYLKIPTQAPERRNRRVAVRRITPLMGQNAQTELR